MDKPTLTIERDHDGFFEALVLALIDQKQGPFKNTAITVWTWSCPGI
jgi:hypothetical protein